MATPQKLRKARSEGDHSALLAGVSPRRRGAAQNAGTHMEGAIFGIQTHSARHARGQDNPTQDDWAAQALRLATQEYLDTWRSPKPAEQAEGGKPAAADPPLMQELGEASHSKAVH